MIKNDFSTQFDRKRYAMQKFGNRVSADPERNLTYHGFLVREVFEKEGQRMEAIDVETALNSHMLEDGIFAPVESTSKVKG